MELHPITEYEILTVPAAAPVTMPVVAPTDATGGLLLDQVPPGVVQLSVAGMVTQPVCEPVMAAGVGFTVMVRVVVYGEPDL